MSKWQGFDQRKICPNCGEYQTRVMPKERPSFSSSAVRFSLLRSIGIAFVPILALFMLYLRTLNIWLLGAVFLGFAGLVILIAYRSIDSQGTVTMDQQSRAKNFIGYRLYCRHCGYTWEMTAEEWETAERKEREHFINYSSSFPASQSSLDEAIEKMENPNRGTLIIAGFTGLSLFVSLLLYGIFWAKDHPDNPYASIVNAIAVMVSLCVYTGLIVVFKAKGNKTAFTLLILVILVGLALMVLRFL